MATEGPLYAGAGADDSGVGTLTWSNTGNITAEDSSPAGVSGKSATSHYLTATSFGFAIPTGSTIDGITVEIRKRRLGDLQSAPSDVQVRIIKGGAIGATDRSSAVAWGTSYAYTTYGSSSDLWGETWTVTDINATDFGLALAVSFGAGKFNSGAQVDAVRITVTYTPPPGHPAVKRMAGVRFAQRVGQGVW